VRRAAGRAIGRPEIRAILLAFTIWAGASPGVGGLGDVDGFGPALASAASPTATPPAGDPRSAGEGPGLVGAPLIALAGVLGIGLLSLIGTLAYVRLTGGSRASRAATGRGERPKGSDRGAPPAL
jgi:hypothetical protein